MKKIENILKNKICSLYQKMTDPRMNDVPDFCTYLHSHWVAPTMKHKAAVMAVNRRGRFFEGYDPMDDARVMVKHAFREDDESGTLAVTGLGCRYQALVDSVRGYRPYGMAVMIAAAYSDSDEELGEYVRTDNSVIILSIVGIARHLLDEYFEEDEIEAFCEEMPTYEGMVRSIKTKREVLARRHGKVSSPNFTT